MMKLVACLHDRRILRVLFIISLLCFVAPASAPGGQNVTSERAKALIGGKGADVLLLNVHGFSNLQTNRIMVPYNPMIYDVDGSFLELKDMRVPCEAMVEYRKVEGEAPQLLRLNVMGYSERANSLFTEQDKPKKLPE
jgi:hypothetical protein